MASRIIPCLLISFLLAGCASVVGPNEKPAIDLVGTRWQIIYNNPYFGPRDYDLIFNDQGRLVSTHPDAKLPDNNTWELRGRKITLRFNRAYAVYTGELTDSDHMSGTATSESGGVWNWKATRWGPPLQLALP